MVSRKKTESTSQWTIQEWKYCITCFHQSETIDEAVEKFNKDYNRSLDSIKSKFEKEAIFISDVLGTDNDFYLEDYLDLNVQTTKDNLEQQITRREILRARKFQSLTKIICEEVKKNINRLPSSKKSLTFKHGQQSLGGEEVIALVSDTHVGEKTKKHEIGGLGEFSISIWEKRLKVWQEGLVSYIEHRLKKNNVGKVHLAFLGDNIDGDDIYPGHGFHIEADVFKQIFIASDGFSNTISEIANYFPKIHFEFEQLGGNHGRDGGKKGFKPYRVNWDLLLGHFISHKLSGHKNVTTNIPESWFSLKQIYGWSFLFLHGDNVKGETGIFDAQKDYMVMLNRIIHYIAIGHQHSEKHFSQGYLKQFVNGDWVGGNSYSKIITKASRPMQLLMTIDKDYGCNNLHSIYFDTYEEFMKRTEEYITRGR